MLRQQKIVPKTIKNKEKDNIKSNPNYSRKENLLNYMVAKTYSIFEFIILKLVDTVKLLLSHRTNCVIRELVFSRFLRLIFLNLFTRVGLSSE